MVTAITEGVKVCVETFYQPDTNPYYTFAYRVTIINDSPYEVQLMRRHWYIYDSIHFYREVEGEGVIGEQPVLEPGEEHTYVSGCHLKTDIGRMHGYYEMRKKDSQKRFKVTIPSFVLLPSSKMN